MLGRPPRPAPTHPTRSKAPPRPSARAAPASGTRRSGPPSRGPDQPARPRRPRDGDPARPNRGRPAPGRHRPRARCQPVRHDLRGPRLAEAQDDLRHVLAGEALDPQQRIGGGDGRRPRLAGGPGTRSRVGEDGPAQGDGEAADGLGAARRRRRRRSSPLPRAARERRRRRASPGREPSGRARPGATAGRCGGPAAAHRGSAEQRFSKGKVRVHRARPHRAGRRLGDEAAAERAPARSGSLVGHAGIDRPPQRPGEQPRLLDGLGRPDVMELRRPVRSADDERAPATDAPRRRPREPRPRRSRSS